MGFIMFMGNAALTILSIAFGFFVFKWILGDGKDLIKEIVHTIGVGILTGCIILRKKIVTRLQKEEEAPLLEEDKDPTEVEAHVI